MFEKRKPKMKRKGVMGVTIALGNPDEHDGMDEEVMEDDGYEMEESCPKCAMLKKKIARLEEELAMTEAEDMDEDFDEEEDEGY